MREEGKYFEWELSRKGTPLWSEDFVALSVEDYMILTRLVLENCPWAETIQKIWAVEEEDEIITHYYRQNGKNKELEFVFLSLSGEIDGKEYLEELSNIAWADPNLDTGEIVRQYNIQVKKYLKDYRKKHFNLRKYLRRIFKHK